MSAPARFLPTVYAPTVGQARLELGHAFRRRRGMYLSLRHTGRIEEVLRNWPVKDVRIVCPTSGGRILGPGEAVPSQYLLPVHLDLRESRISTEELDAFLDEFVDAVQRVFPDCCIEFEDWAGLDAVRLLERYRHRVCCYHGDIQGNAGVAVAGLFSALRITGGKLRDQRILILGAGFAASGVADLIASATTLEGPTLRQARKRISLCDINGLVDPSRTDLYDFQKPYAHPHRATRDFLGAIDSLQPTAIVGVSNKGKAFTRQIIEAMARLNRRPIVFALSKPAVHAECTAEEAYQWSEGRALYAAGQANSRYILPGMGLAIYATRAKRVTDEMFVAAARGVAEQVTQPELEAGRLYPPQSRILETKVKAAERVAELVFAHGLAGVRRPDNLRAFIESQLDHPEATRSSA